MESIPQGRVTQLLVRIGEGDKLAAEELLPLVFDELRGLAAKRLSRVRPGHSLQPTLIVDDAYMRLVDQSRVDWKGRTHFFAVAGLMMHRILIDHRRRVKPIMITLDEAVAESVSRRELDLSEIDGVLAKLLAADPRAHQVVHLRFYSGLKEREVAEHLGVSERTVRNDWTWAQAWLRRELGKEGTT